MLADNSKPQTSTLLETEVLRLEAKGCGCYKVRSMIVDPSYGELEAELENRRHHDPAKVDRMLTNLRKGLYGDFTPVWPVPRQH